MTGSDVLAAVRPFALLAALAFLLGLVWRLAPAASQATASEAPAQALSGPASDDWNLPKRI